MGSKVKEEEMSRITFIFNKVVKAKIKGRLAEKGMTIKDLGIKLFWKWYKQNCH